MAVIPIERKAGKGWLWGLLALALLAALAWWFLASRSAGERTTAAGEVAPTPVAESAPSAPVAAYLAWADSTSARTDAGPDHEYVANGITRLAGAIADLSARDSLAGSAVAEQVQALNRLAVQVQEDRQAMSHADIVRAAFTSSAALLGDIQQRRYPAAGGAVADTRAAAEAITKDRPLLEQRPQMDRFFTQAAAAVRAMR